MLLSLAVVAVVKVFQSTPVITDGRCSERLALLLLRAGFNPRPSSLTGDAAQRHAGQQAYEVSIHARHH